MIACNKDHLVIGICFILFHITTVSTLALSNKKPLPPLIVSQPPNMMIVREGNSIELPCLAEPTSNPYPMYKWTKNGQKFEPLGYDGRLYTMSHRGTLIFTQVTENDEGVYQCIASTQYGTTLTEKSILKLAVLDPFPPRRTQHFRKILRSPLILRCRPPKSFPAAEVSWVIVSSDGVFTPVNITDRVTMDPESNLHFAHLLESDGQNGSTYACLAFNNISSTSQLGEQAVIHTVGGVQRHRAPQIVWQPPRENLALLGQTWRIKCVFSGSPTPLVNWRRDRGLASLPSRSRQESFGQELVIENIQYGDAGEYECAGFNDEAIVPSRRVSKLSDESAPFWTMEGVPQSIDVYESNTAEFMCEAEGIPTPVVSWFINGVPLSELETHPRRVIVGNKLIMYNVTEFDTRVLQCNSTNKHGYVWANAYLNVISEPPIITDRPEISQLVDEGATINLTCNFFGIPHPLLVWKMGSKELNGGRFKVYGDGHLQITNVSSLDSGQYTCYAMNKYATVSATGSIVVISHAETGSSSSVNWWVLLIAAPLLAVPIIGLIVSLVRR